MADRKLRFKVTLAGTAGSSATGLLLPFDVPETFGTRARVPVRGTINGFPFRSSLMPMGGCHMMAVNKTMRDGAKAGPGDEVDVVMERDADSHTIDPPPELKKELSKNKKARDRWNALAFTPKKEMAVVIRDAQQEETKKRRLAKVMHILSTGAKWPG
jgi:Domain of unknown function (DUF1905)/Bacteriocin-protection, YdeI or OmpD-Associated